MNNETVSQFNTILKHIKNNEKDKELKKKKRILQELYIAKRINQTKSSLCTSGHRFVFDQKSKKGKAYFGRRVYFKMLHSIHKDTKAIH